MAVPTQADRAVELNRLIADQGRAAQRMQYGWKPTDEEQAELNRKAERMHELAELLDAAKLYGDIPIGKYLNDRVATWLKSNPLPLSMQRVLDLINPPASYSLEGGVSVVIGETGDGGYMYRCMADDFAWSGARLEGQCAHEPTHDRNDAACHHQVVRGDMVLRVPDSVAEYFRQQGRRALQSELRSLLNTSRA